MYRRAADNSDILNCTFLEAFYILNIPNTYDTFIK